MQNSGIVSNSKNNLRVTTPQQSLRRLGLCSQIATATGGQHSSPIVFPEKQKRHKIKAASKTPPTPTPADDPNIVKALDHRIDIPASAAGDEKSDLLGYAVFSGKLVLDKSKTSSINITSTDAQQQTSSSSNDFTNQEAVDAKLTSKALIWGSHMLHLDDVISVSYNVGLRHFTVHSYPLKKGSCGLSCFMKPRRSRKDFRFLASSIEEAVLWVGGLADQQCYVNCLPHPLLSSKKQASSELLPIDTPPELIFKCKSPPKMLVILNPRSGRGRSSKVFHTVVEPIFKLAGFKLEVVKTTSAGHARKLASSVDISTCPDGIICVGGDGIINEVLNGLLSRDNQKEGISIPIGIVPAGSDNSLVWTVLGVRDPVSAAIAIVKGGLTATDVFAVEWIQTGVIHFGMRMSSSSFSLSLCCSLFNAMASATVVDHHNPDTNPNHLHLDYLPLIDLRLLSQSDLYSLSLTSSSSLSNPTRRFDDDVLIPKIDRSVFNESAGSRKQTYSRLRLAPRNSQFPIPNPKSQPTPFSHSQSRDPETRQIISLLKQLFPSSEKAENDDVLVSVPVHLAQDDSIPGPSVQNALVGLSADVGTKRKRGRPRKDANAVMAYPMVKADFSIERHGGGDTTPGIVVQSSDGKRKRGRPRKDENRVVSVSERERKSNVQESSVTEARVKGEEAEMVMVNENGVLLDLAALGNADDSFGEALRRRTDGLETEAQLLGFLGGLEGGWSSARKKRKIVQASELLDALPRQWKVMLSLKRNGGHVCLFCRRYISPNGQQFVSCKEVSSYLLSYFGVGNTSKLGHTDGNIPLSNKLVSGDDTNITFEDESKADELATCSLMPISSVSTGHEKQATFLHTENSREIQAGEIMGMPKKFDPVKTGVLQTSLKIHESVQMDREATLDAVANYDLSSDFPCAKVNKDIENCLGTYKRESISLSCEEQAMKANKSGKDLGFFEQGSAFNLTDDKLAKADEATDAGISCGETNVFDCFPDGINDGFKASVNSVDVTKVDTDTALNGMAKERRTENIDNNQLSSTVENTKIDDADDFGNGRSISGISESHFGPEDVCTNVKKQSTSEACSLVPSILVESRRERGLCSTSSDEKTCDVRNNFYSESFRTSCEPKCDDIDISGNDDKTISFGSGHAMPDVDAMEISEHVITTGKCSNVPAQDGKSCIALSNAKNPTCSLDELCQEKSFHRNVSTPFVKQDIGSAKTGMVCPSGSASSYALVNNVNNTSSSSMKELKKEEVKRSWNNEVLLAFDSSHGGPGANSVKSTGHERSSEGPSLVRSENSQTFSTGNNSSVLEDKLITGSVNGLICPNGSEQTPGFENSLNRVYSSITWEQPNTENAESSRNNDPMTGFLNHSQPSGDVMAELTWRIEEQNVQQRGLADTSSELMQSSGCHPNFDMLSGKGADGALSVNEKFDNISGLEGLKPGRIEQLEYNFQTAQASSHSKESKVLSYDGEMEQGFSSSAWLEKESLPSMPNIANRPETNICVWCGNEFYHEVYEAGAQTGSVGLMCAVCQAKFSSQFNYL